VSYNSFQCNILWLNSRLGVGVEWERREEHFVRLLTLRLSVDLQLGVLVFMIVFLFPAEGQISASLQVLLWLWYYLSISLKPYPWQLCCSLIWDHGDWNGKISLPLRGKRFLNHFHKVLSLEEYGFVIEEVLGMLHNGSFLILFPCQFMVLVASSPGKQILGVVSLLVISLPTPAQCYALRVLFLWSHLLWHCSIGHADIICS
jgi:hypothetical protein